MRKGECPLRNWLLAIVFVVGSRHSAQRDMAKQQSLSGSRAKEFFPRSESTSSSFFTSVFTRCHGLLFVYCLSLISLVVVSTFIAKSEYSASKTEPLSFSKYLSAPFEYSEAALPPQLNNFYVTKIVAGNLNCPSFRFTASAEHGRPDVKDAGSQDYNHDLALTRESSSALPQMFFSKQKNRNNSPEKENAFHDTGGYFHKSIPDCERCPQLFTLVPLLIDKRAVVAEMPSSPRASPLFI